MGSAGFDDSNDGTTRRMAFTGPLTIADLAGIDTQLRGLTPDAAALTIDLGGIERIDTGGAWLVHRLQRDWAAAGGRVTIANASADAARLIAEIAAHDQPMAVRPPRGNVARERLERIGAAVAGYVGKTRHFLGFLGEATVVMGQTLIGRRPLRWHAVIHQCEQIGVNALGIVGLLLFLVGIVIAQQGAVQLRQFGAEVFVVNLIGRATARELGILLTAIMVAGRSASAFAAQIGSMKLNQEVDAMETIGLSPMELLVVPRLIAMSLMLLLLGFYGAVMALIGGGLYVWVGLDIPPVSFVQRLQEVTPMADLLIGMIKAPVFGIVIALMGCYQGMQVSGNAESVGQRTTQAVVASIFMVIVLDAFFALFFSALGYN